MLSPRVLVEACNHPALLAVPRPLVLLAVRNRQVLFILAIRLVLLAAFSLPALPMLPSPLAL